MRLPLRHARIQRTIAAPQRFSLISLCSLGKFYRHLQSPSKFRKVDLFKTLQDAIFSPKCGLEKIFLQLTRLLMVAELGLEPRTRVYEARKLPLLYSAILLAVPYSI